MSNALLKKPPPVENSFQPVDGTVIYRSNLVTLRNLVLCLVADIWGAVMVCTGLGDPVGFQEGNELPPLKGNPFTGFVMIGLSTGYAAWVIRTWMRLQRMIIGADRFQIVEQRNGVDTVVLQIPYANISELKRTRKVYGVRATFQLVNAQCRDTRLDLYATNPLMNGEDPFVIHRGFQLSPASVANLIDTANSEWRASQTDYVFLGLGYHLCRYEMM